MFLCEKCHSTKCEFGVLEIFNMSRGPCEGCGKTATCYDCHGKQPIRQPQTSKGVR